MVLDNPPFSILSQICEFYLEQNIPFFLFAPTLAAFSARNSFKKMNHIICDATVTYENGARVNTSFVTSYGGDIVAQTAPELQKRIEKANKKGKARLRISYKYPPEICTSTGLGKLSRNGIDFKIRRNECEMLAAADQQKKMKKAIYGGGLLLSKKKAAEKVAAEKEVEEKVAAEQKIKIELSEREKEIVKKLE